MPQIYDMGQTALLPLSPPKEGMLRIFTPEKIRWLWPGSNPRSWVPEASTLTTRPPKAAQHRRLVTSLSPWRAGLNTKPVDTITLTQVFIWTLFYFPSQCHSVHAPHLLVYHQCYITLASHNPFAYTYGWESVWATDVFAFSSSFLSVDGMTCHISF
jgi:hypothetical protein